MSDAAYVLLEDRGVIAVAGDEARAFLQGLISNDMERVAPERAIYAALLTPQGKFLHDFFVVQRGESFVLDCEGARLADLLRRLTLYRLRAKVSLEDVSAAYAIAACYGAGAGARLELADEAGAARPLGEGVAFVDPRLAALGARAILPRTDADGLLAAAGLARGTAEAYDALRLSLGVPDGSRDLVVEKAILLESGFEELDGVDFEKGCFIGQELTARTKYRGLVRKRLMPVTVEGPMPAPGTLVMWGEKEVGEMRSGRDGRAIALIRLEPWAAAEAAGEPLTAGGAKVVPAKPDWAGF